MGEWIGVVGGGCGGGGRLMGVVGGQMAIVG